MRLNFYHDTKMIYSKSDDLYYNSGFNYNVWKRYLNAFDSLVIHTRVLDENSSNTSKSESMSSGENVEFSPIRSYKGKSSIFNLKTVIKEIDDSIKNEDYFLLRMPSVIGTITGLLLIKRKKNYMVEVVGYSKDVSIYRGGLLSKFIAYPNYYLQKKVVENASVATYITEKYLSDKYRNNKKTYKGIPNIHYDNSKDHFKKIKKYEILTSGQKHTYHIGLIGSLNVKYKGHQTAFKAIKELKDRGYKVKLHLVGPGSLQNWEKLINKLKVNKEIVHIGKIPSGEPIDNFLQKLDFYIQPSKTEGHGRALIEAVNNSCVCFGSNVGGIPETLEEQYLFEKNDYKRLGHLIIEHIDSKNKQIENIENNYKKIQKYDPKIVETKRVEALNYYKNEGGRQ